MIFEIKIFISYAREDALIADRLYEDLKRSGINPWMDRTDILAGERWETAIKSAIEKSKFFF